MLLLPLLLLSFIAFCQCNGDTLSSSEIEESFKNVLQLKIDRLVEIKKEVEEVLKEAEKYAVSEVRLHKLEGVPQACLSLAQATDSPCPDITAIITQLTKVVVDISHLVINGVEIFDKTFSSSSYQCNSGYNPFTALRCFLRAFRAAHDNLVVLTDEVTKTKNEALKLYSEYLRYSKQCKDDKKNKAYLLSLCKNKYAVN